MSQPTSLKVGDFFCDPVPERVARWPSTKFRAYVNKKRNLDLKDHWQLHKYSITRLEDYWQDVWDFQGFIGTIPADKPLFDSSKPLNVTHNRLNATLNWAENQLLAHQHARSTTRNALITCVERTGESSGHIESITFKQLYDRVKDASTALRKLGAKEGDRICAFSPNNSEAVIMLLASATIGCIWSSCPPEFGIQATLERFEQIQPTILLSADKYRYGGKEIDIMPKLHQIVKRLEPLGLRQLVMVGQLSLDREPMSQIHAIDGVAAMSWNKFLKSGEDKSTQEIDFNRGTAMRPLWILYSSGTTGKPKSIVHHAGGMLLSCASACIGHNGMDDNTVQLQFTTLGWMMWNFAVSNLAMGTTVVCFDGSPLKPLSTLWEKVDEYGVTSMGLSPRYLQTLLSSNYFPREHHSIKTLDVVLTAGSPLTPELYQFLHRSIKQDVMVVCGVFVSAVASLPTYAGEIQSPALGCDIQAWSDEGKRVPDGQEGNMVCCTPIPNFPLCFWNDKDGEKYQESYFRSFPTVAWNQADWVNFNPKTGGIDVQGRADAVLNPGGVRFGTSELYQVVEEFRDVIDDCLAVGQKWEGDERVILFLKTVGGKPLQDATVSQIKAAIKSKLSNRHVPALILQAPDLPMTINDKRCEIAAKKAVNGVAQSKINRDAMANPSSLDWFFDNPNLTKTPKAKL